MPNDKPDYDALFSIPIEMLALPDDELRTVKRSGVTNLGECVEFIENAPSMGMCPYSPRLAKAMIEYVKPRMRELGYWPLDG